jgi:hypothetical protein
MIQSYSCWWFMDNCHNTFFSNLLIWSKFRHVTKVVCSYFRLGCNLLKEICTYTEFEKSSQTFVRVFYYKPYFIALLCYSVLKSPFRGLWLNVGSFKNHKPDQSENEVIFGPTISKWFQTMITLSDVHCILFRTAYQGSSINDVTALEGKGVQGFCDNSTKKP